jgi:hypothetical protein
MCRFGRCHPLSRSGQLAGPLEVVQFAVPRHVPRCPEIYRAAFHSQYVPRPARPSAGTSTDTGKTGFPPPCTDRAWQVWWCGGWMSLAATALRWLRTGTGGRQASTSPHGGASGAAPSLTPCTATAFLRSCPTVAQEASSLCPTGFRVRSWPPCGGKGSASRTESQAWLSTSRGLTTHAVPVSSTIEPHGRQLPGPEHVAGSDARNLLQPGDSHKSLITEPLDAHRRCHADEPQSRGDGGLRGGRQPQPGRRLGRVTRGLPAAERQG